MLPAKFVSQLANKAYQFFGEAYVKTAQQQFVELRPFIDKFIPLLDKQEERILDIGCGPGFLLEYLKQQGFTYLLGTDISEKVISEAAKRVPAHMLLRQNFHQLNFKPQEFSTVIAINALHYASKQFLPNILKRIFAITTTGAKFLFVLPKGDKEQITEETYTNPETNEQSQHAVYHSYYLEGEIKKILGQEKINVTSLETFKSTLFPQPLLIITASKVG